MIHLQDIFLQVSNSTISNQEISLFDGTTQILLVIAAFAAVAASVIGIIKSNRRTRDSNNLLEKDINSRMRPWLIITDIVPSSVIFKNGGTCEWGPYLEESKTNKTEKNQVSLIHYEYTVKNVGLLSAKINRIQFLKFDNLSRDELDLQKKDKSSINLVPQETLTSYLNLPYEKYIKLHKITTCFGVSIEYTWDDNKKSHVGKIWHFLPHLSDIIDSW